jgi:hypothetical protein
VEGDPLNPLTFNAIFFVSSRDTEMEVQLDRGPSSLVPDNTSDCPTSSLVEPDYVFSKKEGDCKCYIGRLRCEEPFQAAYTF